MSSQSNSLWGNQPAWGCPPVIYTCSVTEYAGWCVSAAADSLYCSTGSFTNKNNNITATVDKHGGLDVVGTGIYKSLSGHEFGCFNFDPSHAIKVTFCDVFGFVNITFTSVCCFAAGTMIETVSGPRAVETLVEGDELWAFGRIAPVTWTGNRTIEVAEIADRSLVLPIRIRAGALSAGLPERDLVVSPDHAIWLDGKLIPARLLVNGVSIVQENRTSITYYHVALDRHDIILAEGVQVESFLDVEGLEARRELRIEAAPAIAAYEEHGFAPLCIDAAAVKPVWDVLSVRAGTTFAANDAVPASSPFVLLVDGRIVEPTEIGFENGVTRFGCALPVGARLVTIASAAASPWSVSPWLDDRRVLGVAVSSIEADGVAVSLEGSALVRGWHGVETAQHSYRWTDGAASLVLSGTAGRLEIGLVAVAETRRIAIAA